MNDTYKYWAVHGGSDTLFAAKDAKDAWELVKMMNDIALEYEMPPTSRVEFVESYDYKNHEEELKIREEIGDEEYLQP